MIITLNQAELNQAVVNYLQEQGLSIDLSKADTAITDSGVVIDTAPVKQAVDEPVSSSENAQTKPKAKTPAEPKKDSKALFNANKPDTTDVTEILDEPELTVTESVTEDSVEKTRKLFQ